MHMKKIILTIFSVIIILIGTFLVFYFWPIKIDSNTISNINRGLGKRGQDMGYNWNALPDKVLVGYLINIKYKGGNKTFKSSCIIEKYFATASRDQYYCQASWPSDFFSSDNDSNKYSLNRYSFTARPTFSILRQEIQNFFKKPTPAPTLKIETEYSLPQAQQGELYNASINILYTGSSPLNATFSNLPPGISVSSGIVNGNIEIKNQKGTLIISGTPTEAVSYEIFLTVSSTDGKSKEIKQFNLFVEQSASSLKIISPKPAPKGTTGQDYTVKFQASGGKPPYSWSYSDIWKNNDFCSSLIMKSDGTLTSEGTGKKPAKGSCSLTIGVKDSMGEGSRMLYGFEIE